jgi:hypothetical protein
VEIELLDAREMLAGFNLLMKEVLAGSFGRNAFAAWEVELLLDIAECQIDPARARTILTGYRNAAAMRLTTGRLPPLKLSEYLRGNQD